MANVQTAFGLRPVRHTSGAPWNGQTVRAYCDADYATALFVGDAVTITPTANRRLLTNKALSIQAASAGDGNRIIGAIVSFDPDPTGLNRIYRPLSTERWANIVLATPDLVFQIRDDGASSTLDFTTGLKGAGSNAVIVAGAGSTTTGLSGHSLDASSPTANQSNQLFIIGMADIEDNEGADYAIWDVIINTCWNAAGMILGVTAA